MKRALGAQHFAVGNINQNQNILQVAYKRTVQIKSERSQTLDPADTLRARLGREGDLGSRNVWVAVQILN